MTPVKAEVIWQFLIDCRVPEKKIVLPDTWYLFPSLEWVLGPFSAAWLDFSSMLRVKKWKENENDCEDFSVLCDSFASILHSNSVNRPKGCGLSFGTFWYVDEILGPHVINTLICAGPGGKPVLPFYEPQNRKLKTLSEWDVIACELCII